MKQILFIFLLIPLLGISQHYQCKGIQYQFIHSGDPDQNFSNHFETSSIVLVDHEAKTVSFQYFDHKIGAKNEIRLKYAHCERFPGKETLICHSLRGVIYRAEIDHLDSEIAFSYYREEGLYILAHQYKFNVVEITNFSSRARPDEKYSRKSKGND